MQITQWLLMGFGIASHLALLFLVFHPKGFTVMAWVFPAVVVLPWALLWVCSRMARGRRVAFRVVLSVSGLYLGLGGWSYWDTIYVHPDPQGGLIFLVMPVLGGLAALGLMSGLWYTQPRPQGSALNRHS